MIYSSTEWGERFHKRGWKCFYGDNNVMEQLHKAQHNSCKHVSTVLYESCDSYNYLVSFSSSQKRWMLLVLSVSSCAILSQLFCHVNVSQNTLPLCFGRCYFFSFRCVLFTLLFFHPLAVKNWYCCHLTRRAAWASSWMRYSRRRSPRILKFIP